MSYQPFRRGVDLRAGAAWGAGTYLVGLALTTLVVVAGLHPGYGLWRSVPGFDPVDFVALHGYLHLPTTPGSLEVELVPYRLGAVYLQVAAGYAAARRSGAGSFRGGAAIVAGFCPLTVLAAVVIAVGIPPLPLSDLLGPVLVAGVLYPVVFGGVGGSLAALAD